jgi:gluconokinase
VSFLHLDGDPDVATRRVSARTDHFMPASLMRSQLEILEPLEPDEKGIRLDFSASVDEIVADFTDALGQRR